MIARGSEPVVRLVPVRPFRIGILAGVVPPGGPDFFEPLREDEVRAWEGRSSA